MFNKLPRPTVFAHRGASAHAPENTLAAFELAVRQGADAIELDVKLSLDGAVMVIHDQTVDRTTGGKGQVRQLSLAQLRELEAGSYFEPSFEGEKIPTLDEVFEAVGKKTFINIELTNDASPTDSLPEKTAELVLKHGMVGQVFFSSFNPLALIRARGRLPLAPVGLLCFNGRAGAWARGWAGRLVGYQALHPEKGDVTKELVESCHQRGKRVHVYTVNLGEDMHRLFDLNVDGIFTDDPVLARQVLNKVEGHAQS